MFRIVKSLPPGTKSKMKMVLIPKGTFLMGSPPSEKGFRDDERQHKVKITQDYWLGVYEVTQAQYQQVMGENPSYHRSDTASNCIHGSARRFNYYLSEQSDSVSQVDSNDGSLCVKVCGDRLSVWGAAFQGTSKAMSRQQCLSYFRWRRRRSRTGGDIDANGGSVRRT